MNEMVAFWGISFACDLFCVWAGLRTGDISFAIVMTLAALVSAAFLYFEAANGPHRE